MCTCQPFRAECVTSITLDQPNIPTLSSIHASPETTAAHAAETASHTSTSRWPRWWRTVKVTKSTTPPASCTACITAPNSDALRAAIFPEQHGQAQTDPQVANPAYPALPPQVVRSTGFPVP